MENRDRIYVGGSWVPSTGTETIDVVNPTTEEVVGRIPDGTAEDADRAVSAAKDAFPGWAETSIDDRAEWDNWYVENFSLWLDVKILVLTVTALVRAFGDVE